MSQLNFMNDVESPRELYGRWFAKHPGVRNPTDINSQAKFLFAVEIGWEQFRSMQQSRKRGDEWSKWSYWEDKLV